MIQNEAARRRQGRLRGIIGGLCLVAVAIFAIAFLRM